MNDSKIKDLALAVIGTIVAIALLSIVYASIMMAADRLDRAEARRTQEYEFNVKRCLAIGGQYVERDGGWVCVAMPLRVDP